MKKWISVLLIAIFFCLSFATTLHAEKPEHSDYLSVASFEQKERAKEDYIYYSDLFYGFPVYLTQNSFFQEYTNDTQNTFTTVFTAYKNSEGVVGTALENAMDLFTSPSAIVAFASDYLGITNFDYNKALDSANKKIMLSLLSDTDHSQVLTEYGKVSKVISNIKKVSGMIDNITEFDPGQYLNEQDQEQLVTSPETLVNYYLSNVYKDAYDAGVIQKFNNTFISRFFDYLSMNEISLSSCFSTATNAVDIAKTIMCCIVISDADMELIDDILATQSEDTILKMGMTRLKNQLAGGSVTYFLDTYVTTGILDQIGGMFDNIVKAAVPGYGELALIVKQIKNAAFSLLPVAKYDDVMTYKVLESYSYCLAASIINKAQRFRTAPFLSQDIYQYEALFRTYVATNKLAIKALEGIAEATDPYGDIYEALIEARENGVESVLIEYKNPDNNQTVTLAIPSIATEKALIEQIQGIVEKNINFTLNNSIKTIPMIAQAIRYYCQVKLSVKNIHTVLHEYSKNYDEVDIYGLTMSSAKQSVLQWNEEERLSLYRTIHEGWQYNITSNMSLRPASDDVEKNTLYGYGYNIYGDFLILGGTLTTPANANVSVDGKINLGDSYPTKSTLVVDGILKVTGKIYSDVNEYMNAGVSVINNGVLETKSFELTSNHNTIRNNGTLISHGDFKTGWGNYLYQQKDEAVLRIGGNYSNDFTPYSYITAGTVVLDGEEQQTVKNFNVYNLTIENQKGIKYLNSIQVRGLYNTNNNPIELNGNVTYIYDTTDFYGDYDYKTIVPAQSLSLKTSVKAFIAISDGYGLTIPEGLSIAVDGDINLRNGSSLVVNGQLKTTGKVYSHVEDDMNAGVSVINNGVLETKSFELTSNHNTIRNNGTLISHGDFKTGWGNYLYQQKDEAVLRIGGNYSNDFTPYSYITAGTVVLDGEKQQTVKDIKAPTIIIENDSKEGVIFTTAISPSVLFNHNGNKYTLKAGGTFVDYDGDGLKDNVDPEPAVGNPCVINIISNNNTFGTVDTERIETIGGTKHTVTATPTFKYEFIGWRNATGKTVSTTAEYTFVAKTNDTLTAIFRKRLQPIVKQAVVGGKVNAPSNAEIESSVFVTITENEGYMFTEGSLKINGETIAPGSFVMPDVPVTITAEFVRNENYFALKDAIAAARKIPSMGYTNASVEQLQDAIALAQAAIRNHISEMESNALISAIDEAQQALESSCKAQISMKMDSINIIFSVEGYLYGDSEISPIPGMIMDDIGGIWGISYSINGEEVQVTNYSIESKTCTMLLEGIPYNKINQPITIHVEGMDDDWDYWDFEYTLSSPLQIGAELFDANGDGNIDIRDLIRMKKLMSEMPQSQNKKLPDLDGNGDLNALDLTYLIKILLFS